MKYTREFKYILPLCIIVAIGFEVLHLRWSGIDYAKRESFEGKEELTQASKFFDGLRDLGDKFFVSGPTRRVGQMLFVMILVLALSELYINWCLNIWDKEFYDGLEKKQ